MLAVAFVIAGGIVIYIVVRMMLAQTSARLRKEFQQKIDALTARVETEGTAAVGTSAAPSAEIPQTVGAIAAAAAALGATKVQVRPVKPTQTRPGGDPWAQQGRAGVWSAHDLAQRWH